MRAHVGVWACGRAGVRTCLLACVQEQQREQRKKEQRKREKGGKVGHGTRGKIRNCGGGRLIVKACRSKGEGEGLGRGVSNGEMIGVFRFDFHAAYVCHVYWNSSAREVCGFVRLSQFLRLCLARARVQLMMATNPGIHSDTAPPIISFPFAFPLAFPPRVPNRDEHMYY